MTRTARILSLVILAASMAVSGAMPAFGAPATTGSESVPAAVPAVVKSWMTTQAIPFVAESSPTLKDATSIGTVRRVYEWSPALWSGRVTSTPLAPTSTWVASLHDSNGVIGVVTAALQPDKTAVNGAFSSDSDLGKALDGIRGSGRPVQDATVGEWFVVNGDTIAALNDAARRELPKPSSLSDFVGVVATRTSGGSGNDIAKTHALIIVGVSLGMFVVLAIVGVIIVRRRRNTTEIRRG